MAHVSGDVDGIFGGSPDTYIRDLQCVFLFLSILIDWACGVAGCSVNCIVCIVCVWGGGGGEKIFVGF
jgi:hypothetical protein